jgi:glycosyltransferase involved in cell wall biosynthesis
MGNDVCLVIPVFNEFESLVVLISQIENLAQPLPQFVFVNNGSTDERIHELLLKKSAALDCLQFLFLAKNVGFGGAIKAGIQQASSHWVGWMPCNLKVDLADVLQIVTLLGTTEAPAIKCRRIGRPTADKLKTLIAGLMQSLVARKALFDSGGTPTFVHRNVQLNFNLAPNTYAFESYIMFCILEKKVRLLRPKIKYGQRRFGKSHWQNSLSAEYRLLKELLLLSKSLRKRESRAS